MCRKFRQFRIGVFFLFGSFLAEESVAEISRISQALSNSSIFQLAREKFLEKKRKYQLFFLTILMVVSALLEVFSLASFIPFITSLSNPEKLLSLNFITNQINFFGTFSQ